MKISAFFGCVVVFTLLLQGCAVANRYNFSDVKTEQALPNKFRQIAGATSGQRQVMKSGERVPSKKLYLIADLRKIYR